MGSVVEISARPSGRRPTPTSTPFAGPTATSFRFAPRWRAITVSKKRRLTLPIGYFGGSPIVRRLLGVPGLKRSSRSLRPHDRDQVPRVYPALGILSAPRGLPDPGRRGGVINLSQGRATDGSRSRPRGSPRTG